MQDAAHSLKALFTTIYQTVAQMFVQEFGLNFEPADRLMMIVQIKCFPAHDELGMCRTCLLLSYLNKASVLQLQPAQLQSEVVAGVPEAAGQGREVPLPFLAQRLQAAVLTRTGAEGGAEAAAEVLLCLFLPSCHAEQDPFQS